MAEHFDAVPTAVGGHDGAHARLHRRDVARQVDAAQRGFVDARIALVEARAAAAAPSRTPCRHRR